MSVALLALVLAAEVQDGPVRVAYGSATETEPARVAAALRRAQVSLPAFTGAGELEVRAVLCDSWAQFAARTGLPRGTAAGVVEDEIVFPPASVTARLDDLDAVARHEVAHLATVKRAGRTAPRWLLEGIAAALAEPSSDVTTCVAPGEIEKLLRSPPPRLSDGYRAASAAARRLAADAGGLAGLFEALGGPKLQPLIEAERKRCR